jgi:hypothetical protein
MCKLGIYLLSVMVLISQVVMAKPIIGNSRNLKIIKNDLGPGSTGGGESPGQQFMAIAKKLPAFIETRGSNLYPEVNLNQMRLLLGIDESGQMIAGKKPGFTVETEAGLKYNGVPKVCVFDSEKKIVKLDPKKWDELNSKLKFNKNIQISLVLHEILGLMGIEKNDDYSISSRSLGSEYLSLLFIQATPNRIISSDLNNRSVIYWRESKMQNIEMLTYFFCKDPTVVESCILIGQRSYSKIEIAAFIRQAFLKYENLRLESDKNPRDLGSDASIEFQNFRGSDVYEMSYFLEYQNEIYLNLEPVAQSLHNFFLELDSSINKNVQSHFLKSY